MKRLSAIFLALALIFAACGETNTERSSLEDETDSAGVGTGSETANSEPSVTATDEPTSTATSIISTVTSGDHSMIAVGGGETDQPEAVPSERAIVGLSRPTATPFPTVDPAATLTPVPSTATPSGPTPTPYPPLPTPPQVTSCEQAADVTIDLVQIFLDALVDVTEEDVRDPYEGPDNFQDFNDELTALANELQMQAFMVGCSEDDLSLLVLERVDQLVANNPAAQIIVDYYQALVPVTSWTIDTCEDAADAFIERTQALLDALVGLEGNGSVSGAVYLRRWGLERDALQHDFRAIGCTEDAVTSLIGQRIDLLVPRGEAVEDLAEAIRRAVAENDVFSDLD